MQPMDTAWVVLKASEKHPYSWGNRHDDKDYMELASRLNDATKKLQSFELSQESLDWWKSIRSGETTFGEAIAPHWQEFKDAFTPLAAYRDKFGIGCSPQRNDMVDALHHPDYGKFPIMEKEMEEEQDFPNNWWHEFFNPSQYDDDIRQATAIRQGDE